MIPKGKLLLIGGGEDKGMEEQPDIEGVNDEFEHFEILKTLLVHGKVRTKIEVITSASEKPEETAKMYRHAFKKIGLNHPGFMNIESRPDTRNKKFLWRLAKAHAVLFSGGDQFRISTIIGGTQISDLLMQRYIHDKNFIVAGSSAGSMVLPRIMISEGGQEEALLNPDLKTTAGLGFLKHCIVDTHFVRRGRFGRLSHAIIINPGQLGVGLGEDTAILVKNGTEAECLGSGMVIIIDGKKIGQTNITEVQDHHPIFVENLVVHILVKGCRFSFKTRKMAVPAMSRKQQAENKKSKH
jgi:cyanophycinase